MQTEQVTHDTQTTPDVQTPASQREKRLDMLLVGMGLCVAGLLATLALPWLAIQVQPGTMAINGTSIALQGGTTTVTGLDAGVATPLLIGAAVGVGAWLAAQRRWWWAIVAGAVMLMRTGLTIPLPVGKGSVSLAESAIGHQLASFLWPAFVITLLLVALQTALVRQAEKDAGPKTAGGGAQKLLRAVAAAVSEAKK